MISDINNEDRPVRKTFSGRFWLDPDLSTQRLEDAFRKLAWLYGVELAACSRFVRRLIVGRVTLEPRRVNPEARGGRAQVIGRVI